MHTQTHTHTAGVSPQRHSIAPPSIHPLVAPPSPAPCLCVRQGGGCTQGDSLTSTRRRLQRLLDALQLPLLGLLLLPLLLGGIVAHGCRGTESQG